MRDYNWMKPAENTRKSKSQEYVNGHKPET